LGLLDANKANDIAQSLLPYALGSNLDFLGQIYGVTPPARGRCLFLCPRQQLPVLCAGRQLRQH